MYVPDRLRVWAVLFAKGSFAEDPWKRCSATGHLDDWAATDQKH